MNQVFIVGGGVAGLTAAHELSDRGFTVTVFEREKICGGKARSMANTGSGVGGNADWPGEHGFRFFPGFYWHVSDTMSRIADATAPGGKVLGNLMASETIGLSEVGKPLFLLKASRPDTLEEWVEALQQLFMNPSLGVPVDEARFFITRLLCFLGAGKKRRLAVYEGLSWWEFTEAQTKSDAYKNIFARGLSRSLVAMKPDTASTLTVASMLVQILVNIVRPAEDGRAADRVLNAPTNDAWINPWVTQLKSNPNVQILNEHVATQLTFNAATKKITSLSVTTPGGPITVGDHTDYYVAAVPVDVVQTNATLFPPALKAAAKLTWSGPSGAMGVDQLKVDWMTGVLFYLKKTVSAVKGHIIHCTSPWALTSISQAQFWGPYSWTTHGDGTAKEILSTIISDWDRKGDQIVTTKTARQCTKTEILDETWAQVKAHMALTGIGAVADADVAARFLDPAIEFDGAGVVKDNHEPLLVNTVNSRRHRPPAKTDLTNLFVASDYVSTNTDLACMEAANEAARQATNALLAQAGSAAPPCHIEPLKEPTAFTIFQQGDDIEFTLNPGQPPLLCRLVDKLLPSTGIAAPGWFSTPVVTMGIVSLLLLGGILYLLLTT